MNTLNKRILVFLIALQLFCLCAYAQDKEWRPVSQEELQSKTPKIEADADAEALFWEVRVADEFANSTGFRTVLSNYIRIKIFTEKGRDEQSKVDIPFGKAADLGVDISVRDIAARTVKPNGVSVEVKAEDIFERETVKGNGIKFKSRSFVFPSVEAGSIIEYRWKEIRANSLSYFVRLKLARDIPVQLVKYYIKPVSAPNFNLGMRLDSMNTNTHFSKEANGFYSTSMQDVSPVREEEFMPSEYVVEPWVLAYYEGNDPSASAEAYWQNLGRKTFEYHKSLLAYDDEIKEAARHTIGDATDTISRVERIYEFCRDHIVDVDDDASGLNAEQRKKIKPNKKTSDALSRAVGTSHDKEMLFGAMLASIGIDVRIANVAKRTEPPFDKSFANAFFNRTEIVAAKIDNEWRFFDPASRYLPFGDLPWTVQGQPALISDPSQPFFRDTPVMAPERSQQKRSADLRLSEDGTIEGDVKIEFSGELGRYYKELNDDLSPAQREKSLVDLVKRRILDSAEVTAISINNLNDGDKPFTYSFHLRIPAFVNTSGKRIFLQPNVFERSTGAKFVKGERRYDIFFDYAWSENDDISIQLPEGYTSDLSTVIPPVADDDGNLSLVTKMELSKDRSVLKYHRAFVFGRKLTLTYSKYAYSTIKGYFDAIHHADTMAITLVKDTTSGSLFEM